MIRTLLLGTRVLDPGDPAGRPGPAGPTALETVGDRITWVGDAAQARDRRTGALVLDRPGTTLTPVFVDAHVHATATGLLVDGLDLAAVPGPAALLDAVGVAARRGGLVWGHGWDETRWSEPAPGRVELDRAAAGAPVYLSRVDVHSALVSTELVRRAPGAVGAAGWSADGAIATEAHHQVRRAALAAIGPEQRDRAQRAFLADAARRGIGVVHECAGPDISGVEDLANLRRQAGPEVVAYWGEAVATAGEARALLAATGARGLAGDLFVDGSLGSRTAALRTPYADAPGCSGHYYLDADRIAAHVASCTEAGVQAGFHVIGDDAVAAVVAGFAAAAASNPRVRGAAPAHRVEHLEMVDAAQARTLAGLGVVASVQPAFDAAWGGEDGMYAARLGPSRAAAMNPFATLHAAGVTLAFGSDAPVTPLDPWGGVRAAVKHRTPGSGLRPADALAAHTVGGHRAAGDRSPTAGQLVAGAVASYALWDGPAPLDGPTPLDEPAPLDGPPRSLLTVHRGRVLFAA